MNTQLKQIADGVALTAEQVTAINFWLDLYGVVPSRSKTDLLRKHEAALGHGGWLGKDASLNTLSVTVLNSAITFGYTPAEQDESLAEKPIRKEDITIQRAENNELGFDDELYSGIRVIWRHDAIGQGTIDLVIDKSTGQLLIDTETMGKDIAKLVFEKLIDEAVE